jgi:type IV pilus assembly protein PilB
VGSGIRLIQAQRLLRRLCLECREHAVVLGGPTPYDGPGQNALESFAPHRAIGCDACQGLGYTDERILVCESMPFLDRLQQLVIEKASESEVQAEAVQEGMTTLRSMALSVPRQGVTTLDEVYLHTPPD